MNVVYTGKQRELTPALQKKLDSRFAKLSKMVERRGEKETHVVLTTERHLHKAEITLHVFDHALVGLGSDADEFTAVCEAIDNLSKQVLKLKAKWRDTHRGPKEGWAAAAPVEPAVVTPKTKGAKASARSAERSGPRVYRVNHHADRKPMTLEEAILEMEAGQDYVVYRDAEKDCVSVLVRRRDGDFDLVEG
jgi:putative sigma-54 modulation protein